MITEELEYDLLCARCGYSLRGLARDSRCPECGEPIRTSLDARRAMKFSAADTRWLRQMAWAPALVILAVALWTPRIENWYVAPWSPRPALVLVMFLSPLAGWLAAWKAARARPQPLWAPGGRRWRANVLRAAATVALSAFYLRLLFRGRAYPGATLILYVSGVLASSALLHRALADLLTRMSSPRLARWHWWASWAVPALLLLHLVTYERSVGWYLASYRYWEHLPTIGWGPMSHSGALWWDLTHLSPADARWWVAAGVTIRTALLPPLLVVSLLTIWRQATLLGRTSASSRP